jgi:hypothetical protein
MRPPTIITMAMNIIRIMMVHTAVLTIGTLTGGMRIFN